MKSNKSTSPYVLKRIIIPIISTYHLCMPGSDIDLALESSISRSSTDGILHTGIPISLDLITTAVFNGDETQPL